MLADFLNDKQKIGFVPTMGALHQGHISLIQESKKKSNITICSIFVNPTQFNDKNDLINYPRTIDDDIKLLEKNNCDVVFIPSDNEIYSSEIMQQYEFGNLAKVMEASHRPGHFNGMANVVQRLFDIIKPQYAFFGEKDFQQLLIVKELVKQLHLAIEIIPVPIIREENGLAMSSRNSLLSLEEKQQSIRIYSVLKKIKELASQFPSAYLKTVALNEFKPYNLLEPEYIEILNEKTLEPISDVTNNISARAFMAVKVGKIRLIDNIKLS